LDSMFKYNPKERPSASTVLEHPWFERPATSQQPLDTSLDRVGGSRLVYHSSISLRALVLVGTVFFLFLLLCILVNIRSDLVGVTYAMVVVYQIR
jgi:serine/threonine protein kinase